MESEPNNNNNTSLSSTTTNWTIAGGSIVNCVTFESALSPITDQDNDDDSSPKSPIILYPASPDQTPCQITITFAEKFEVRQVYVRSTARVYEIYYTSDLKSSNEYLCTVRCGIAARDEEVLRTPDIEIADVACLKGPGKEVDEKKLKNDSNLSTNEDGWVEIKVPDTYPGRSTQDFFEATAEITDANPCISLTIRLLSLQNKGYVFVDEVYVYADPVPSAGTENQVGQIENPAGSSLMAMLVPTLLQLSKTKAVSELQDKQSFDAREKHKSEETGPKSTDSSSVVSQIQQEPKSSVVEQQEVKLQEAVRATAEPAQLETPLQVSNKESKPDLSGNRIEKVLDQLVSRVSRIEDLFLRFEESMLKPISSIDSRLQQVEQQLEVLTRKSQNSGLPSGTRIFAPEFSCLESDENSFCNNGYDNHNVGASGKDELDFSSAISPDDNADLENATQPIPSLVITAPEFSNADDEEEIHGLESVTDSPEDKPRHTCSIDDALASALIGFLSSTIEPRKYTQALAVKAPDFSNEDGSNDKKDSPKAQHEVTSLAFTCIYATDGTEFVEDSVSTTSHISSLESEGSVNMSLNNENSEKLGNGVDKADEQCQRYVAGEEGDSLGTGIEYTVSPVRHDMKRTNSCQLEYLENGESSDGTSNILGLDKADILKQVHADQTDDGSDATQEGVVAGSDLTAAKEAKEGSNKDIVQDVLEFSLSSVVDFEIPILDVKFISQENSNTKSPLEALLAGIPESNVEASCVEESVDDLATGNLISVEDVEVTGPATDNHFSVDVDYCSVSVLPLNMDGEKLQDYHACTDQEMSSASLI